MTIYLYIDYKSTEYNINFLRAGPCLHFFWSPEYVWPIVIVQYVFVANQWQSQCRGSLCTKASADLRIRQPKEGIWVSSTIQILRSPDPQQVNFSKGMISLNFNIDSTGPSVFWMRHTTAEPSEIGSCFVQQFLASVVLHVQPMFL